MKPGRGHFMNHRDHDRDEPNPQGGFSLMEILASLTILAFGLLSLASLQANSLRNNQSAYLRSQATYLAYDILDRMRANSQVVSSGTYDTALGSTPTSGVSTCIGSSVSCSEAQMAAFDVAEWKCTLGNWTGESVCSTLSVTSGVLPSGDGSITRSGDVVAVTVRWVDDKKGNLTSLSIHSEMF